MKEKHKIKKAYIHTDLSSVSVYEASAEAGSGVSGARFL